MREEHRLEKEWEKYEGMVDWDKAVYLYLTSSFGTDLYFWKDGSVTTMQYNEHPIDTKDVVAVVRCPGIENIDTTTYEEGFIWDDKEGWIDEYTGERAGRTYSELISYLMREVGLMEEEGELKEKVKEQFFENIKPTLQDDGLSP